MGLYNRILGHPFVYKNIRPLVVGGIDMSAAYRSLQTDASSVVLDIGCGTGAALGYLNKSFQTYVGIDIDEVAIRFARERHRNEPNVSFECRMCRDRDMVEIQPSHVVLAGLLHHLDDKTSIELLEMVQKSPRLVRALTIDIVYLKGALVNNLLARLDRGKFCRYEEQYYDLVSKSGMSRAAAEITRSHPDSERVKYLVMILEPGKKPAMS
jgi:SAM-dependent methyltransferase